MQRAGAAAGGERDGNRGGTWRVALDEEKREATHAFEILEVQGFKLGVQVGEALPSSPVLTVVVKKSAHAPGYINQCGIHWGFRVLG